jgi:hypothetical protein
MPRPLPWLLALAVLAASGLTANSSLPAGSAADDPGAAGPLPVASAEYDLGAAAYWPPSFPDAVELRGVVFYPADLSGGPYPLLVFLHGRHRTCYAGSRTALEWPCAAGREPIPNYRGYDYLGRVLASQGFVVISVSANGINALDNRTGDRGVDGRGELVLKHLDLWRHWNAGGPGPFGTRFVGKVDLDRVGLMGHSRGGEGVVEAAQANAAPGRGFGIRAVWLLAPQDYGRPVLTHVPLAVLLPYCDGDISSLRGVQYYDDARYAAPGDPAPKHLFLVMGANHNYYSQTWTPDLFSAGSQDDWLSVSDGARDPHCGTGRGNQRLSAAQQRGTALAFGGAFFRAYVRGEEQFADLLVGDDGPPPSAQGAAVHVSYHPPDRPGARRDVNRFLDADALVRNDLGGTVSTGGLSQYDLCGGPWSGTPQCLPSIPRLLQPHTNSRAGGAVGGVSQLRLAWTRPEGYYWTELPAGQGDVVGFEALQFRVAVSFADPANLAGQAQDFQVVLTDGAGRSAATRVSDHSAALFYPPGAVARVPKALLNTARIPLSAFPGVDLRDVRSIELRFDQRPSGALLLTDLAFAGPPAPSMFAVALH